ncbi:Cytochrome bo(3) ubiquinol oxidase subunit 4 [Rhodobacteraceae bacterium THAF1]|uniref:cytochrome o ubiquinol oxidase subunit IV n=1 Tax=Palleronia sp. THAF1 TaxID=2587842 RepID=UPI000F40D234|nr:cytochrome o ubiquinol oxidase subunit IV [Palleronia sp. THAF1]QFU08514.1 Cytochrome bo(3) ubiquinol oxidase subunit 4 [Palleronia sp. THAF1]VDC28604.1 Cytochrome bo(3) ubiquinol oxidase subunit 4 [Rhodobacteraceae bacterium THAF1]
MKFSDIKERLLLDSKNAEERSERRFYTLGLVLSVVLTVLSFGSVMSDLFPRGTTIWLLVALALAQIVVHLRIFLHIDLSHQKREDLQVLLFTILLLSIMGFGTLWVLADLMDRMM